MPRVPSCLIALAAAALCCLASPGLAQDLAADKAVFEDPTGRLTFEDARQQIYRPYRAFLNEGYTSSVFWIRLTVRAMPTAADQQGEPGAGWAIVRMRPIFVDHVELFDPADMSGRRRITGDRHEWLDSEHPSLTHTFVIRTSPVARQIWLRLETTSSSQLHVQVLPWKRATEQDRKDELRSALLAMVLVSLALIGVVAAVATHTTTDYAFAAMQAANLPYAMYVLGYLRPLAAGLLPATALDVGFTLAVFGAVHLTCWFYYFFVQEHLPSRAGSWLVTVPLFVLPLLLVVTFTGRLELALHLNAYTVLVLPLTMLVAACTCTAWRPGSGVRPAVPRWLFLGASCIAAIGAVLWFISVGGWMKSTYFLLYGMIWFTAIIGIVMLTVLLVRTRRIAMLRAEATRRAQIAESLAQQAGQRRAEQAQFLSMLTDEVKSGLAVMRMVIAAPAAASELREVAEQAVASISRAIDRCGEITRGADAEPFRVTATPVEAVLDAVRADTAGTARVVITVEREVGAVTTDTVTLRRLLVLLLENALMHGAHDTPVDLSAAVDRRQGGGLLIWTSNLPGISGWPDPAQVFTRYYRSPGARRLTGSGLGLHLASTLAAQLGGQLRYAPTATHIRFVLWLPR